MTTSAVGAAADPPAPLGEPPSAHPEPARTDPRLSQVELPDGQTPRPGHLCEACGVAQRATRKPRVPASTQLATLARAVHALVEGQPLADADRQLLRDLVG